MLNLKFENLINLLFIKYLKKEYIEDKDSIIFNIDGNINDNTLMYILEKLNVQLGISYTYDNKNNNILKLCIPISNDYIHFTQIMEKIIKIKNT